MSLSSQYQYRKAHSKPKVVEITVTPTHTCQPLGNTELSNSCCLDVPMWPGRVAMATCPLDPFRMARNLPQFPWWLLFLLGVPFKDAMEGRAESSPKAEVSNQCNVCISIRLATLPTRSRSRGASPFEARLRLGNVEQYDERTVSQSLISTKASFLTTRPAVLNRVVHIPAQPTTLEAK